MQVLAKSARQQLHIVRTYPAATAIAMASALCTLYCGNRTHRTVHAIAYLIAVWLCAFATDVVVNLHPSSAIGFPIHHSPAQESVVILACTALGQVFLYIRFSALWNVIQGPPRYALITLMVFTYPIVLALIYLFVYRYKTGELGVNLHFWYLPLFIHLIWGGIAIVTAPKNIILHSFLQQNGIAGTLLIGVVCAAIAEEFTRMLLQTRLGALVHNKGVGFIAATTIWVCMHIPMSYPHTKGGTVPLLFFSDFFIRKATMIPLGLLWGYMTQRTKSALPAVLVHGFNFWGLQNSFFF